MLINIWLVGFLEVLGAAIATSGLIYILLVMAIIANFCRLLQGRSV